MCSQSSQAPLVHRFQPVRCSFHSSWGRMDLSRTHRNARMRGKLFDCKRVGPRLPQTGHSMPHRLENEVVRNAVRPILRSQMEEPRMHPSKRGAHSCAMCGGRCMCGQFTVHAGNGFTCSKIDISSSHFRCHFFSAFDRCASSTNGNKMCLELFVLCQKFLRHTRYLQTCSQIGTIAGAFAWACEATRSLRFVTG